MTADESSQRRLTVNAAFLKDIKDDNRHLKELLDRLKPIAAHDEAVVNHWDQWVSLLGELRDQLAFHFSLEEAYGYFDSAIGTEPRLSAAAEVLRNEHRQLFETARDLADRVADLSPTRAAEVDAVRGRYLEFVKAFQIHEEAELELILRGLEDDLGVGD